ncbi:triose-phosphate isomerase [Desulfuromonas sp. KJ2020]|uniref:triose-phosphate isomerase n=1 Tax=Desulfuromonas sp. KJ2020 TaxID=2919173 RepID=UPI0020A7690C|nr:triose-phosphate isomerase [Desulfuromonas sp. KJ2020]MCP3178100.1 triose-phosphate isomerase [Desulfuromonas sp. KJ2020]
MRKPIIAGNWKLHKTVEESRQLIKALAEGLKDVTDVEIVVAPVFTSLESVVAAAKGSPIAIAAQNCYPAPSGAFTGEVSPALLKDVGCIGAIVGHSERRQLFGESNAFINNKVQALLAADLRAIFCIGETLDERESGRMYDILTMQVKEGLAGLTPEQMAKVVVAYEPVWAIGTGKTASNEEAEEAHAFIRGLLQGNFNEKVAENTPILYGGSVKPGNVDGLMAQEDIDGVLVGGASLVAEDFIRIVRFERTEPAQH